MLPAAVKALLMTHIDRVRAQHQADIRRGPGGVELPGASSGSIPTPVANGRGRGAFRPRGSTWTAPPGSVAVTISTNPFSSVTLADKR
jgi:hypothetical protein